MVGKTPINNAGSLEPTPVKFSLTKSGRPMTWKKHLKKRPGFQWVTNIYIYIALEEKVSSSNMPQKADSSVPWRDITYTPCFQIYFPNKLRFLDSTHWSEVFNFLGHPSRTWIQVFYQGTREHYWMTWAAVSNKTRTWSSMKYWLVYYRDYPPGN